ncbi:MAG: LexA family protein [Verrucomicrobiia bacterium]
MSNIKKKREVDFKNFANLVYEVRKRIGLTQSEFAQKTRVSLRTVQLWEKGIAFPRQSALRKLSEITGLPIDAFLGANVATSNATQPVPIKSMFPKRVPVVSWAKAGLGGDFGNLAAQIDEWIDTDCSDPQAYALIIEGDSMMPEFKPGDRVIFMPNVEPRNGDVVVARLAKSGDVLFKLFHRTGPNGEIVRLTSFNPVYPPLEYQINEFEFIHPMHSMVRIRNR